MRLHNYDIQKLNEFFIVVDSLVDHEKFVKAMKKEKLSDWYRSFFDEIEARAHPELNPKKEDG